MFNEINVPLLVKHVHNLTTITNRSRQRHFFNVHWHSPQLKYKHGNKIEMLQSCFSCIHAVRSYVKCNFVYIV